MKEIAELLNIVKEKQVIDQSGTWSNGSSTYFDALKKELDEVQEEINKGTRAHLEDELGDILWGYLNVLVNLEHEGKITVTEVFRRSLTKYSERVDGIKAGKSWKDIKIKQKAELQAEEQVFLKK